MVLAINFDQDSLSAGTRLKYIVIASDRVYIYTMCQRRRYCSVLRQRKSTIFLLIILTVSLTTLGIRLPGPTGISANSCKPKPRHRAVIQNQIKTCKQIIKSLSDSPELIPERFFLVVSSETDRIPLLCAGQHSSKSQLSGSSRAPPSHSA